MNAQLGTDSNLFAWFGAFAVQMDLTPTNSFSGKLTRLEKQLNAVNQLLESYTEQFKVGERSLLDVLDTQNSRFSTQIAERTARKAVVFAEYRVLASAGRELDYAQFVDQACHRLVVEKRRGRA